MPGKKEKEEQQKIQEELEELLRQRDAERQVPPPPHGWSSSEGTECCDRFRLLDGFLVDGKTGDVWRYDKAKEVFAAVPRDQTEEKKQLGGLLVKERLQILKEQYSKEVLRTLPRAARAKQLAVFDRDYLEPIRVAARIKTSRGS